MLDVKRMRILREVARQGSFSAAADALYLSQSAVSQQIATLERETGTRLIDRTRSGPRLTDAGRVLTSHADAILSRLAEAERELDALAGLEGGELRLASFPSASAAILTEAVAEFSSRHPLVSISVAEAEPEDAIPLLLGGEIDLALVFDYPGLDGAEQRDLETTLLLEESMSLVVPASDPLAARESLRLAEFSEANWLCGRRPSSCAQIILRACRDEGFEPRIAYESDDYNVLQGFVAAGLGFTLMPDMALVNLRSDLVARTVVPAAPTRRIRAATRAEASRSLATDAMLEILLGIGQRIAARSAERRLAAA
ncbi:LysR family transcriptional regulator [Thermoleophilia bacterium SCSIO 60948]|nr:LysR family transcriptional regulator [Thermoleophilia bacterium SCSIO 60948]